MSSDVDGIEVHATIAGRCVFADADDSLRGRWISCDAADLVEVEQ